MVQQANLVYKQTCRDCPGFRGRVSIVGHSLGTVIVYDLLILQRTEQENSMREDPIWDEEEDMQFEFKLENFFMMGSPVTLFTQMCNREQYVRDQLPTCENFWNIYHPSDLIAYRVEPVIRPHPNLNEQDWEDKTVPPPVLVPCYWNKGMNYSQQLLMFVGEQKGLLQSIINDKLRLSVYNQMHKTAAYAKRYDYVLQERSLETFVKTVGILQSHTNYFKTADVAMFILMKIHNERIKIQDV